MFSCYLKLERRQSVKKDGTEATTPRYVATAQAGYFKPLQDIKNPQNEIVMFCQPNGKCNNKKSTAEIRLQCNVKRYGSVNFSSMYFDNLKIGEMLIGYGEPDDKQTLSKKGKGGKMIERPNPFYENKCDGYLFIVTPDMQTVEVLIVPDGRYLIQGVAKQLADGQLDAALEQMRKTAKTM